MAVIIVIVELARPATIEVNWTTASEYLTAGFNIYRSETPDGDFQKINDSLIHGQADTASGAAYSYTDHDVEAGKTYYYRLEDIEYDGTAVLHEVIDGQVSSAGGWMIALFAFCLVLGLGFIIFALRSKSVGDANQSGDSNQGTT